MKDHKTNRELIVVLAVATVLQLPFLWQAFHIDDNVFLMIAENTRHNPWFPQDIQTYFEGLKVDSFISHEHPLLLPSLLLAPSLRTGFMSPELAAHLTYLPFFFLLIISTYWIARPLTRFAAGAALLTAFSPVVFVSSHTVMSDVPYVALLYGALALILSSDRPQTVVAASIACGAAVMFAYQAVFFLPVLYLAALSQRRSRWWLLLTPGLTLAAYGLINSIYFERFIWSDLWAFWSLQPPTSGGSSPKLLHAVLALAGAIVFPASWLALAARKRAEEEKLEKNRILLMLGIFAVNIFLLLAVYHASTVRYWLPSVPVICIVLMAAIDRRIPARVRRAVAGFMLVSTACLSLALAHADRQWAGFYRSASSLVGQYRTGENQVWIAGEWGFRWYFTRAGAQLLGRGSAAPKPGDILLRPKLASPYLTLYDRDPGALHLERTIHYHPSTPIRLLDFDGHAGFYSHGWGVLPYSINLSGQPLEQIFVYRVKAIVAAPVREPTYWEWNRPDQR